MHGLADRVGSRGASADMAEIQAAQPVNDRDVATRHVSNRHGNREGRDPSGPALHQSLVIVRQGLESANARADRDPDAIPIAVVDLESTVGQCLARRAQRKADEAVAAPRLLCCEACKIGLPLHFGGEANSEFGWIEPGDGPRTGAACNGRLPGRGKIETERTHTTHSGHDDALGSGARHGAATPRGVP